MEDKLTIFKHPSFGEIRTAGTTDNPMFCLADVCKALELDNVSQVLNRLGDGVISKYPILDSLGRMQEANFINEDGLYDVIFDSRKPEAKSFRKWVTSEVLPSIRRTGSYGVLKMTNSEIILRGYELLLADNKRKSTIIERQSKRLQELQRNLDRRLEVEKKFENDDILVGINAFLNYQKFQGFIRFVDIYSEYVKFCRQRSFKIAKQRRVGMQLVENKYPKTRKSKGMYYDLSEGNLLLID